MTWSAKLAPWRSVADAGRAVDFYRSAFGAVEPKRLEGATSGFSRSRGWGSARRTSESSSTPAATRTPSAAARPSA
jgi:uncharacterized glyoxalase superfamily protein PhnB